MSKPFGQKTRAPVADDTQEFVALRYRLGEIMYNDQDVRRHARELLLDADKFSWSYQWTWLGLPIIQMPPDIVAIQEVIWRTRPQIVIETGVARGGSLMLTASILHVLGEGRVVGIDIDMREHNRAAIRGHPLSERIELIEGSSVCAPVVDAVRTLASGKRTMVILDSNHSHEHVLEELQSYAPLVTPGQYIVVADTVVEILPPQTHREARPWGPGNNPATALGEYLAANDEFEVDEELNRKLLITSTPGGYLRRRT